MEFTGETIVAILVALLAISEVLAFIPSIKANSVFQAVVNIIGGALKVFRKA